MGFGLNQVLYHIRLSSNLVGGPASVRLSRRHASLGFLHFQARATVVCLYTDKYLMGNSIQRRVSSHARDTPKIAVSATLLVTTGRASPTSCSTNGGAEVRR